MRKALMCAVLAWWFVGNYMEVNAVGPFRDQAACEQMRAWVIEHKTRRLDISWCFWDGKS